MQRANNNQYDLEDQRTGGLVRPDTEQCCAGTKTNRPMKQQCVVLVLWNIHGGKYYFSHLPFHVQNKF